MAELQSKEHSKTSQKRTRRSVHGWPSKTNWVRPNRFGIAVHQQAGTTCPFKEKDKYPQGKPVIRTMVDGKRVYTKVEGDIGSALVLATLKPKVTRAKTREVLRIACGRRDRNQL